MTDSLYTLVTGQGMHPCPATCQGLLPAFATGPRPLYWLQTRESFQSCVFRSKTGFWGAAEWSLGGPSSCPWEGFPLVCSHLLAVSGCLFPCSTLGFGQWNDPGLFCCWNSAPVLWNKMVALFIHFCPHVCVPQHSTSLHHSPTSRSVRLLGYQWMSPLLSCCFSLSLLQAGGPACVVWTRIFIPLENSFFHSNIR